MPKIVGQDTNNAGSIADSLKSIGESMYRPIDPVSRERIRGMQMQSAAKAKMIDALQRGDLIEYGAQGIQGGVPFDDALGYARQAGLIGPDWKPTRPLYDPTSLLSPQPPAPMATGSNAATTQQFAPQTVGVTPWS